MKTRARVAALSLVSALCALLVGGPTIPGGTPAASYIVQGRDLASAADAVRTVGGEITHELAVIHAVGARMTADQRQAVATRPGVRRLWEDRTVEVAAASTETVRDDFSAVSYGNNDGSVSWDGDWIEIGESNGPSQSAVDVAGGRLRIEKAGNGVFRRANIPVQSAATLTFDYRRLNLSTSAEYVAVEVSDDSGGSWTEVGRLSGPAHDSQFLSASLDVSAFTSFGTMVRFLGSASLVGQQGIELDFVQIEYTNNLIDVDVTQYVADEFTAVSYSNDDGSTAWTGPWLEVGESDGPVVGRLRVEPTEGKLRLSDTALSLVRQADLSAAVSAQLTLEFQRKNLADASDYVALEISGDGGATWTELDRFTGPQEDAILQPRVYDVLDYAASDTTVRFRTSIDLGVNGRVFFDNVRISYTIVPDTHYPTLIGADQLHAQGIDGTGVTVAAIDTGYFSHDALDRSASGQPRVLAQYDAINDLMEPAVTSTDTFGHGTHLTSVMLSSHATAAGKFNGIAPGADLVSVKAFSNGTATYSDVIRGIDWVVSNKAAYGIGVLNLSMSAPPTSYYWDDPLNQAVMRAWQAGIVVVVSAGNKGPAPMTIGVPGNVPYVITVGAMTDALTPADPSDDFLASWSSAGPTVVGFVKPELVAPGGHMLGLMALDSTIAQMRPEYRHAASYFTMSGTSQSAAVVSSIAALMLDHSPSLTPDDVKCRLLATARAALDANGNLAYSIFQQGAGLAHAYDAVHSTASGCANLALDVDADLAGTAHYGGPARREPTTDRYYHADETGFEWDGSFYAGGFPFLEGGGFPFLEGGGFPFLEGSVYVTGFDWLDDYPWTSTAYAWSTGLTEAMSVNQWVPQE